jgi:hypothetical protein
VRRHARTPEGKMPSGQPARRRRYGFGSFCTGRM